ncbi:MAG TPA: zeta toxin family protein [Candidatus Saccharimonadales bacterium]|nr:zeta toxin family protein [Candidatus Saccharimonadales bacterium]
MLSKSKLDSITRIIQDRASDKDPFVIAIGGFGGSGKTTITQGLAELLGNVTVINLDDFMLNRANKRSADGQEFDLNRFEEQVLKPIKQGKDAIRYEIYDWDSNSMGQTKETRLQKYVIVEGTRVLQERFSEYYDYTIWLNVPLIEASNRGKQRDRVLYHVNHDKQWDTVWSPNDNDYYLKHKPQTLVDSVINN